MPVQKLAATLAMLGLLLPPAAVQADQPRSMDQSFSGQSKPVVIDIALDQESSLQGTLLDEQGMGIAGQLVLVQQHNQEVLRTVTGEDGSFSLTGLRGGLYVISAGQASQICRVWAPGTSPPAARSSILLVNEGPTIRGQGRFQMPELGLPIGTGFVAASIAALFLPFLSLDDEGGILPPSS